MVLDDWTKTSDLIWSNFKGNFFSSINIQRRGYSVCGFLAFNRYLDTHTHTKKRIVHVWFPSLQRVLYIYIYIYIKEGLKSSKLHRWCENETEQCAQYASKLKGYRQINANSGLRHGNSLLLNFLGYWLNLANLLLDWIACKKKINTKLIHFNLNLVDFIVDTSTSYSSKTWFSFLKKSK